jgi:hypothetical protein
VHCCVENLSTQPHCFFLAKSPPGYGPDSSPCKDGYANLVRKSQIRKFLSCSNSQIANAKNFHHRTTRTKQLRKSNKICNSVSLRFAICGTYLCTHLCCQAGREAKNFARYTVHSIKIIVPHPIPYLLPLFILRSYVLTDLYRHG